MFWGPLIATFMLSHADTRCTLRVSAKGVAVDGDRMTSEQAIASCKRATEAIVIVEDDAPVGAWPALRGRLERERIKILMRGVTGDSTCMDNPLAKGCQ